MAKSRFFIEKRRDKKTKQLRTKNVPIRLVFSFDGHSVTLSTGENVDFDQWDHKGQRVRKTARGSTEINDVLLARADNVHQAYRELRIRNINPTPDLLLEQLRKNDQLKRGSKRSPGTSIFNIYDKYLGAKQSSFSKSFSGMMNRTKRYVQEFAPDYLSFEDIDVNFMEEFSSFLTNRGLSINTVASNIRRFKMFLNFSIKNGDNTNLRFKGFTPKSYNPEIFYMTIAEMKKLMSLTITDARLDRVRDIFIFGCYTALRYSDILRLRKNEIVNGDFIHFRQVKTKEENSVPLVSTTKAILEKYKSLPGPLALPVITTQKMNDYIKELGQLAGFNEQVTVIRYFGTKRVEETYKKWEIMSTHMMRRTFISNSLIMQIPESEVMAISGHKSYNSFKRYFKVRDEQKVSAMQKWENSGK